MTLTAVASSVDGRRKSPPAGFRFHPGHTWVRLLSVNLAFVGTTDFAVNFAGELEGLSLPREFRLMVQGEEAWVFTSAKGRRLSQVAPVGGQVLAVNRGLFEDVGGLTRSPYHHGWLLCLQSGTIPDQIRNLLSEEADRFWMDRTCSAITSILGSALRLPFRDGEWSPAFGDSFSDEEWEALRHKLFPACRRGPL
jgi:glycine cleavage system H lipoate-binding protein